MKWLKNHLAEYNADLIMDKIINKRATAQDAETLERIGKYLEFGHW